MILNGTEVLSNAVGRVTDRVVRRLVKKEVLASCLVYCFPHTCGDPSCAHSQPDLYRCHDYCSGTDWYQCFYIDIYCSGFCWSQQC